MSSGYNLSKGLVALKSGSGYDVISTKYIKADSYIVTKSISDLDSYRDADGVLHRNALDHVVYKIEFNTPALMSNVEMGKLTDFFYAHMSNPRERKVTIRAFVPEINDYIEQEAYMPDANFTIYGIFDGVIKYDPVRFAFIGY